MLEQPDSPTASHTKQQVFDHYLYRLQSEIHNILSTEDEYEERVRNYADRIKELEEKLLLISQTNGHLLEESARAREKLEALEAKNQEKRLVCLIDGNGTIFSADLLAQGEQGGRLAALKFSESVHYHLSTSTSPCTLWVYIFYNKHALLDVFSRAGPNYWKARDGFDDFVAGFNQGGEQFIMVDVGHSKEVADAKIKAHLEDNVRSPCTSKILFGCCHDNGYIPAIDDAIACGQRHKIILLSGYNEMASEYKKLQLPTLVIPDLFMRDKITMLQKITVRTDRASTSSDESSGPPSPTSSTGLPPSYSQANSPTVSAVTVPPSAPEPTDDENRSIGVRHPAAPTLSALDRNPNQIPIRSGPTYRNIIQHSPSNSVAPPYIVEAENAEQCGKGGKPVKRTRRIMPYLPLHKHEPPPCTLFYLAASGCKHGSECRFGHDYELREEDYDNLRISAKKIPCPTANRGEICFHGDDCCYGHVCPFNMRCTFNKQGNCKFQAPNMHRPVYTDE